MTTEQISKLENTLVIIDSLVKRLIIPSTLFVIGLLLLKGADSNPAVLFSTAIIIFLMSIGYFATSIIIAYQKIIKLNIHFLIGIVLAIFFGFVYPILFIFSISSLIKNIQ